MQVGVRVFGDESWCATCGRNDVDAVFGLVGHAATYSEQSAVGRQAVAAGAMDGRTGIEKGRRSTFRGDGPDLSLAIEDEGLAVARPVGRLEVGTFIVDYDGAAE